MRSRAIIARQIERLWPRLTPGTTNRAFDPSRPAALVQSLAARSPRAPETLSGLADAAFRRRSGSADRDLEIFPRAGSGGGASRLPLSRRRSCSPGLLTWSSRRPRAPRSISDGRLQMTDCAL
ncbi:hypothetical protein CLOM_g23336 [Closterium sp. NIES-68]|nr:hypothetical protein CLOM_g23336 [Closterium sp. NIES-68]